VITIHQRYRQTDGRRDRQTTCDCKAALCTKVHRAVKSKQRKNSKTKLYPPSVAFYDTRPGNEMGLFYNTPEPTQGTVHWTSTRYRPQLRHVPPYVVKYSLIVAQYNSCCRMTERMLSFRANGAIPYHSDCYDRAETLAATIAYSPTSTTITLHRFTPSDAPITV